MQSMNVGSSIDEGLYSRQLYVLGHEAMARMISSNVLIVGLGGLGVEIAKNVILAGVKTVTLFDKNPVRYPDLSSQVLSLFHLKFYFKEEDIGEARDKSCLRKLAELNSYVPVNVLETQLDENTLKQFKVVVTSGLSMKDRLSISQQCRANGIYFINAEMHGLFGMAFCDFGENFIVSDVTGEPPHFGLISSISDGMVYCLEEHKHGLEDGDFVIFKEVRGMEGLCAAPPMKIKVVNPNAFYIDLPNDCGEYLGGGVFEQKSYEGTLGSPEILVSDFAKFDRSLQLHVCFLAKEEFIQKHGSLPRPRNVDDSIKFLEICKNISQKLKLDVPFDEKVVKEFSFQSGGEIGPMGAVLGGFVAQEVLKACSGKFHPLFQYFYFDSLESLPSNIEEFDESNFQPCNSRYDGQIIVFGKDFQNSIGDAKTFLVGAGAIGCEMLKNWALMGIGSRSGKIYVTDMDTIEKSNLNRQFFFRSWDVSKLKSQTAADAVISINPDLKDKIIAFSERVGQETENLFNEDFFMSLDFVTNALDNVDARKYMDLRCVYFRKPLLESGTLGTKGNTQVVVPHLTESYSSSQDPPEKSIPVCTLRNFPNLIEHTIEWAMDEFRGIFTNPAESVNQYLSNPEYIDSIPSRGSSKKDILESIRSSLTTEKPNSFKDCVTWARLKFEEYYSNNILQLLYAFPPDMLTNAGLPFWSGPKRAPKPVKFDVNEKLHLDFIISAANIRAFNYGLNPIKDVATIKSFLETVMVPEFTPKKNVKIQVNENEADQSGADIDESEIIELQMQIPAPSTVNFKMIPAAFEKDDDTNYHIDFVTAAANLRALNYGITPADRHKTKGIAGKIIPAIATTTSLVSGLVCLELYKILDKAKKLEDFKNGFVNLALPFFGFSEPILAPKFKYGETEWTLWDRFDISFDMTLKELMEWFKQTHGLEITMVSHDRSILFAFFLPKDKRNERMNMKVSALIEMISKKPIPSHVRSIVLEILANNSEGDDVEVPYINMRIR